MRRAALLTLAVIACGQRPNWEIDNGVAVASADTDGVNTMMLGSEAKALLSSGQDLAVKSFRISFTAMKPDRLGNDVSEPILTVTFRANDVKAANFSNLDPWEVLDLAAQVTFDSERGRALVARSCVSRLHPNFCKTALG